MGLMKFGLFGINNGPLADPDASVRAAQAAEAAGFDSVWTGEHVVLPDPQEPPAPAPPHVPMLDPAVSLSYLAAHTLSGSRSPPGSSSFRSETRSCWPRSWRASTSCRRVGCGSATPPGTSIRSSPRSGIPFDDRGARCDEYLDAMLELWDSESPDLAGDTVRFSGIDAHRGPCNGRTPG